MQYNILPQPNIFNFSVEKLKYNNNIIKGYIITAS